MRITFNLQPKKGVSVMLNPSYNKQTRQKNVRGTAAMQQALAWKLFLDYVGPSFESTSSSSNDRGTIEVPIDNDTVIYQSEDGQYYEIDVDELIEADDDNEITYGSKARRAKAASARTAKTAQRLRRNCTNNFMRAR